LDPTDDITLARRGEIVGQNTRGCILGCWECIREVIKKICGCGEVVELKALALLPDINPTELCDVDTLIVEQMLAEMTGQRAAQS
jgi:hypothetical protein